MKRLLPLLLLPTTVLAEPIQIMNPTSVLKMLLVLVLIIGLIYMLNKFAKSQFNKLGDGKLSIISSIPVGPRERAVLLDVEGEKILIGVANGVIKHISTIHKSRDFVMNHKTNTIGGEDV